MNKLKIIKLGQKVAYFVGLGCFGGAFVINAQPKNPDEDRMFLYVLGIGVVICLGMIIGLRVLEGHISKGI